MNEEQEEHHLLIDDVRDFGDMRTCRNYHEGIVALQERTWDVLWLDYDMGIGCYSGMDVLLWLEQNPQHQPKEIKMVSLSPDARREMAKKWESIRLWATDKAFVLSRREDATCEKLFEHDGTTYSFAVIQPYNSYVMGSGETEDAAWQSAATNIRIKEDRHRRLTGN